MGPESEGRRFSESPKNSCFYLEVLGEAPWDGRCPENCLELPQHPGKGQNDRNPWNAALSRSNPHEKQDLGWVFFSKREIPEGKWNPWS